MNARTQIIIAAWLASAAMFAGGPASAEPRAAQTTGADPVPDGDMDAWLGRMVEKFRFEGVVNVIARGECPIYCVTVKGTGDCIAVGNGPGVQCILNATWEELWEIVMQQAEADSIDDSPVGVFELPGGIPYLDPAMALFGLDPGNSAINYLLVNNKGMPEGGLGFIKGNKATFRTRCVNEARLLAAMKPVAFNNRLPDTCERTIHIEARPDSKVAWMTIEIDINEDVFTRFTLTLRRQAREVHDMAPASR
jgi:hypothetical protein